jgi:hypothetical protein
MNNELAPNKIKHINVKNIARPALAVAVTLGIAAPSAHANTQPNNGGVEVRTSVSGGHEAPAKTAKKSHLTAAQERAHERKIIKQINEDFTFNVQDGEPATAWMGTVMRYNKAAEKTADGVTSPGMAEEVEITNPFVYVDHGTAKNPINGKMYVGKLNRETATVSFHALTSKEKFVRNEELTQIVQSVTFPQTLNGLRDFNSPLQNTDNFGNVLDEQIPLRQPNGDSYPIAT